MAGHEKDAERGKAVQRPRTLTELPRQVKQSALETEREDGTGGKRKGEAESGSGLGNRQISSAAKANCTLCGS